MNNELGIKMYWVSIYCMLTEATYQPEVLFLESTKSVSMPISLFCLFTEIGTAL